MKKLIVAFSVLALFACNPQKKISGNYEYKTECLNIEMDGSQTVKAWGTGRNRWDAIEQARKNAVNDILFNGNLSGNSECNPKPVVLEVNAREKYEDYFNKFFADGGKFKDFVTYKDERILQIGRDRKKARQQVTQGVVLRVERAELRKFLIDEGIIK